MNKKAEVYLNGNFDIQNALQSIQVYDFTKVERVEIININQNKFLLIVELK